MDVIFIQCSVKNISNSSRTTRKFDVLNSVEYDDTLHNHLDNQASTANFTARILQIQLFFYGSEKLDGESLPISSLIEVRNVFHMKNVLRENCKNLSQKSCSFMAGLTTGFRSCTNIWNSILIISKISSRWLGYTWNNKIPMQESVRGTLMLLKCQKKWNHETIMSWWFYE